MREFNSKLNPFWGDFRDGLREIPPYQALLEWWEEAKRLYVKCYKKRFPIEDADELMQQVFEETYHYVKVD